MFCLEVGEVKHLLRGFRFVSRYLAPRSALILLKVWTKTFVAAVSAGVNWHTTPPQFQVFV